MPRATPRDEGALGVIILAGGRASRFPGKLALDAGGVPLLVRVFRNVRTAGPVYVSAGASSFGDEIDAALEARVIVDREPGRGPLGGLHSVLPNVHEPYVFVVAGDAPFVDASVVRELSSAWESPLQAVVPVNSAGLLEPLCALYERAALLGVAGDLLAEGSGSVAAAVERLATRRVRLSNERVLANVNTPSDRRLLQSDEP
jgi:molybdopterin-guanine dinucleotide biosynthesis protein A